MEARDTAEHPAIHRRVHKASSCPAQNISNAEVGKSCCNAVPSVGITCQLTHEDSFNNGIATVCQGSLYCLPPVMVSSLLAGW